MRWTDKNKITNKSIERPKKKQQELSMTLCCLNKKKIRIHDNRNTFVFVITSMLHQIHHVYFVLLDIIFYNLFIQGMKGIYSSPST